MQAYVIDLELMEPLFFASREIGNFYETEGLIGNYALTYALGLARAPWSCPPAPTYREDLSPLASAGLYVFPAGPTEATRTSLTSFNALSDAYWYEMVNNAVNVQKGVRARPVNRPQIGRIKQLAVGNRFRFVVLATERAELPRYIRLGKWMSKARLEVRDAAVERINGRHPVGSAVSGTHSSLPLNSFDLLHPEHLVEFDITRIYPAPLLRNAVYDGPMFRLRSAATDDLFYPADVRFGGNAWSD